VAPVSDEDPRDDILGDEVGSGEGDPSAEDLFIEGADDESQQAALESE